MFRKLWQWLIVAGCSVAGIACSHSRCNQCSSTAVRTTCPKAAPIPIVAMKPCPCGKDNTYVVVPAAPCKTCPKAQAAAPYMRCTQGKTAAIPAAPCNSCAKGDLAIAPQRAQPPRVLDPQVAEATKSHLPLPRGVAMIEDRATAGRDPGTNAIRYAHANDFAWVVGQLQYLHSKQQWRVRYAPCDVDDLYGGIVVITGLDHLAGQFKEGANVRLQGQLVDPDGRKPAPEYYTYDVKVLE